VNAARRRRRDPRHRDPVRQRPPAAVVLPVLADEPRRNGRNATDIRKPMLMNRNVGRRG
jgi:hypothetical protein